MLLLRSFVDRFGDVLKGGGGRVGRYDVVKQPSTVKKLSSSQQKKVPNWAREQQNGGTTCALVKG